MWAIGISSPKWRPCGVFPFGRIMVVQLSRHVGYQVTRRQSAGCPCGPIFPSPGFRPHHTVSRIMLRSISSHSTSLELATRESFPRRLRRVSFGFSPLPIFFLSIFVSCELICAAR
ncbi:hypothetical protein LY76DRAFT_350961 [Colletotrichum caudatum]|nr:hypothetical protein LY76DRAFT_350961 [Colletotrichum caudatum]